mmetsp:Transcript_40825/g.131321  ORF Transcript_40825/g.131321 Transcript_40825/m.131321 type:complete len:308 (+) Transcript_40825:1690-2613(+)
MSPPMSSCVQHVRLKPPPGSGLSKQPWCWTDARTRSPLSGSRAGSSTDRTTTACPGPWAHCMGKTHCRKRNSRSINGQGDLVQTCQVLQDVGAAASAAAAAGPSTANEESSSQALRSSKSHRARRATSKAMSGQRTQSTPIESEEATELQQQNLTVGSSTTMVTERSRLGFPNSFGTGTPPSAAKGQQRLSISSKALSTTSGSAPPGTSLADVGRGRRHATAAADPSAGSAAAGPSAATASPLQISHGARMSAAVLPLLGRASSSRPAPPSSRGAEGRCEHGGVAARGAPGTSRGAFCTSLGSPSNT